MRGRDSVGKHSKWLLVIVTLLVAAMTVGAASPIKTQEAADAIGGMRGIDVSKYQGSINWERVARDDVKFVLARASIGTETDDTFVHNATQAHNNGILVGAYHYAKFTDYNSMLREAETFLAQLEQVEITYPVALDIEAHRNLSKKELTRLCLLFAEEVKHAGYEVMIYSYQSFFQQFLDLSSLQGYKLWVANYTKEPSLGQHIWQHTSSGEVLGISTKVDINIAYDDIGLASKAQKSIKVNGAVSRSIKETLNARYGTNVGVDYLDMIEVEEAVAIGLQKEVNKQFGLDLAIYDYLSDSAMRHLKSINYTQGQTKGNITYLIQVKLFYKGMYSGYPTGAYDDDTAAALARYQREYGLPGNGALNPDTLDMLLR